ncbi:hypothetical protein FACS189487_04980 [Campylobacterota bacterium]|nr:hypothetical protein FACS189487_04980 [Campylobacterota bacterium]
MDMNQLYDSLRDAIDNTKESREEAGKHYDYYYGDQLPPAVMNVLQQRGQPVRWENEYRKIASKIEGYKIQQRQEIRVVARQVEEDRDISHMLILRIFIITLYGFSPITFAIMRGLRFCLKTKERRTKR